MKAGFVAAAVSGLPSTVYNLVTGRDPLEATKAAGTLLLGEGAPPCSLVVAALPMHLAISLSWAALLERTLPPRRRLLCGAGAGLAIAILDLRVIGRRYRAVRALPLAPQLADHALFGTAVAWVSRARS